MPVEPLDGVLRRIHGHRVTADRLRRVNSATCSVLAGVFPIVLLALVLERRSITLKLRRRRWVRGIIVWGVASSLIGEVCVVVGVQLNGFVAVSGSVAWTITAVALVSFALSLLMIVVTDEIEEDAAATDG
jgi:hypothetical protein